MNGTITIEMEVDGTLMPVIADYTYYISDTEIKSIILN